MTQCDLSTHVHDPARLAALHAVALLDTPTEASFDRLTWLASKFCKAPVALVSLVDAERQFFKSCRGLPEPWQSRRETPLSHSFCQHNRIPGCPLLIEDARTHPLFKDNPAIKDLGVISYLGIPLVTCDGYVLGSFCVIDREPRRWSDEEISAVEKLSCGVMTEISLRTEIKTREQAEEQLKKQNEELREAYLHLEAESAERLRALDQLRERDQMLVQQSRLAAMGELISNIAHHWRQPLNTLGLLAQELPVKYGKGSFNKEYLEEVVGKMMEYIRHMSETIDNFMTFFRPEKEKANFNVADAVQKSLDLLRDALAEARITTSIVAAEAPAVLGYPNEYSQVVLNILANAKEALVTRKTLNPAIVIEIGSEVGRSVVTITDNAGGIPDPIVGKIFDPYFTTKGPGHGCGISLFMSKMIIEKNMGGSLSVSNVPGGARFRIVL